MSGFNRIKLGLEEAIAYEQEALEAKTTKMTIEPVDPYEVSENKVI